MAISQDEVINYLSNLTVIDLVNLTKALEDKWGVKAAPVAVAAAPAAGGGAAAAAPAAEEKTEFTVVAQGRRHEQDRRHQGGPRGHWPRAQGRQGPSWTGAAQGRQGRHQQDRVRRDRQEAQGSRRRGRGQVVLPRQVTEIIWVLGPGRPGRAGFLEAPPRGSRLVRAAGPYPGFRGGLRGRGDLGTTTCSALFTSLLRGRAIRSPGLAPVCFQASVDEKARARRTREQLEPRPHCDPVSRDRLRIGLDLFFGSFRLFSARPFSALLFSAPLASSRFASISPHSSFSVVSQHAEPPHLPDLRQGLPASGSQPPNLRIRGTHPSWRHRSRRTFGHARRSRS